MCMNDWLRYLVENRFRYVRKEIEVTKFTRIDFVVFDF